MTEDKKIKIGKLCNKIATVLFVLFFIDTCVMPIMNKRFFITSVVIIGINVPVKGLQAWINENLALAILFI